MTLDLPDSARVLVDVDGTLCANLPRLVEYVDAEHGVGITTDEVTEWSYPVDGTGKHVGQLIDDAMAHRREWFLLGMDPIPGADEAMRSLSEAGHDLHIATHRPSETHEVTEQWLAEHDIPYDAYEYDVPANKGCLDGDLLVDDYHRNVGDTLAEGKAGALFRQPYSDPAACEGALVVDSWADLVAAVR
ncbi:5' nucleotidase, NT5C type [Halomarina litorea]|uniref:5' nucleotidase, NT5C type n=1 Tax=Halomarina litorea TaxID=2961595 RepID=UPI0020C4CB48|nr:hypothetical protein [Halomarina sp. BCD28]